MTDQTKAAAPLLRPLITTAGLAAAVQASTLGKKCEITHIGLSATPGTAAVGDKTLPGEAFRVPVADGRVINEYQVNVSGLIMDTHPSLSIHGIGFYLSDGTLFALHRETAPFLNHTAGTTLLVGMDMVMNNIPSDVIHVESTGANLILGDFVPLNRRVNNKVLDKDITLNAADVGALSTAGGGTVTGPVRIMHASGLRV
ncbi:MAG: phage tail protein, partial [Aeromonas sobria]